MNLWVEFLLEVKEMREHQTAFFKNKDKNQNKILMAKAKFSEIRVNQLITKLEETCAKNNISLIKDPIEDESQ